MDAHEVQALRALMEYEATRKAPPPGFPKFPDIPGGRYTDPRFFELEQAYLWRKSWLLASHIDEVPEPGCYRVWEMVGQPVVIVHARSGAINAFYNTCRHRGAPVVAEESGKANLLVCRYHGWSYDHEGKLIGIRDPEDFVDLDLSCRSLVRVRCERFGNLIFVNFDPDAPTLLEWLGPIAEEWEEFQFDKCRLASRHVWDLDCNWKVAMEANTEVYHVRSIHPTTVSPGLDDRRNVNSFYPNGHGRMVAPGRKGPNGEVVRTKMSFPRAEVETVGEIARTCSQSYGLFPNWVSPLTPYAIAPLLFWPNGIGKSRLETFTFAPDWGDEERPDIWTVNGGESLGPVLQEDVEFGKLIQKSLESYGFTGVPLSYQEARIYHWNQFADQIIGIERIPPELRVAQVIGPEWIWPNDARRDLLAKPLAAE